MGDSILTQFLGPARFLAAAEAQQQAVQKRVEQGPNMLVVYKKAGHSYAQLFGSELLSRLFGALLIVGLLSTTRLRSYWGRVAFVVAAASVGGIMAHVQYFTWYSFSIGHTAAFIADVLVGWFLAGLAIAGIFRARQA